MNSFLCFIAFLCFSNFAFAAESACSVIGKEGVEFTKSSKGPAEEYANYENATFKGITFYLRAGHGVIRLEAWKSGKFIAGAWTSGGNEPPHGDFLSLEVQTPQGYVEVQCDGINAATDN